MNTAYDYHIESLSWFPVHKTFSTKAEFENKILFSNIHLKYLKLADRYWDLTSVSKSNVTLFCTIVAGITGGIS